LIGRLLSNRYKIIRELGSGGMAWVYLAYDTLMEQEVAIKVLFPQFSRDAVYLSRFYNEARLAMVLNSPYIVKILDYGAERDTHYLVMEYVEGRILKEVIERDGPIPWPRALEIAAQVVMALEEAHKHGIVHRDIKPQNIMITPEGDAKVLDFGLARVRDLPSVSEGGFLGSPHYIAPEQAIGEKVDIRSDIYSLGVVIYEMVAGRPPYDGDNPWAIISQHISAFPPPLASLGVDVPEVIESLILKAMAKAPRDRFQTPSEFLKAIRAVLEEKPLEVKLPALPSVEELYEKALEAFENEDWSTAFTYLSRIQTINPEYRDVKELLTIAGKRARLEALYRAATEAIVEQRWEEARDELQEMVAMEPSYRDAIGILSHLDEARFAYERGLACWERKDWAKAAFYFGKVHSVFPFHTQAQRLAREAFRRGETEGVALPIRVPWQDHLIMAMASLRGRAAVLTGQLWALALSVLSKLPGIKPRWPKVPAIFPRAWIAIPVLLVLLGTFLLLKLPHSKPVEPVESKPTSPILGTTPSPTSVVIVSPTPSPPQVRLTLTPEPSQPSPEEIWEEGEGYFNRQEWDKAIEKFYTLILHYPDFKPQLVRELLCSSFLYKGREKLRLFSERGQQAALVEALDIFEQGLRECPEEPALAQEEKFISLYLQALSLRSQGELEEAIKVWEEIYSLAPDYLSGKLAEELYQAYLEEGALLEERGAKEQALRLYEKALALNVADKSQAEARREALLATPTPRPPKTPLRYKYPAPKLLSPADGAVFHGKYTEIYLEWEPVGELAPDEFYNVTVMRFWQGKPYYWGDGVRETRWKVPTLAGYKEADRDTFYWWVVVKRATTTTPEGKPDGPPISPQSETWKFFWY